MEITASLVMELRNKTGVSMMACKNALMATNGNMEEAIEYLRKKGEAKALDKADRITNEGRLFVKVQDNTLAVTTLLCETDFVARNEDFAALGEKIVALAAEKGKEEAQNEGDSLIKEAILKLGEKISIASIEIFEGATWGYYIHSNFKVGAIVSLENGSEEQAKDIAMHITASNPSYLSPEDAPADEVEKEKEIMRAQLKNEGKPEAIWDKIMEGKVKKFKEDNALLSQPFLKNPDQKVADFAGSSKVTFFKRISL